MAWALAIPLAAVVVANRPEMGVSRVAASAVYVAGAVVCHQKAERSFRLAGQPLPVCARCTGIYIGAALAVVALAGGTVGMRRSRVHPSCARPESGAFGLLALGAHPRHARMGVDDRDDTIERCARGGGVADWSGCRLDCVAVCSVARAVEVN